MNPESKISKRKSTSSDIPRDALIDGSMGYVGVNDIRKIFTDRIRKLDTEIWPLNGRMPMRAELLDFFSTIAVELMQKAQFNYEQFCKQRLIPTAKPAETSPEDTLRAQEARRARMEKYRTP